MNKIVIVFGPPGCGKTRNAEKLRQLFPCKYLYDGGIIPATLVPETLYLVQEDVMPIYALFNRLVLDCASVEIVSFERLKAQGYVN